LDALDHILSDLTEPQRSAVVHTEGPLLVLAGAGSGKTRVITRRAAFLALTVTEPWHVLAITFTNKAAAELQERIHALAGGASIQVGTFHGWCARTLRMNHEQAGVDRNFTIYDQTDRRQAVKHAIEATGLSTSNWSPARVESRISDAKNQMITPEEFEESYGDWSAREIARVYRTYEDRLSDCHALDFDDLLLRMAVLLREDEDFRDALEDRHRYLLIDEYQDTNLPQYRIAKLLARKRGNICATGDPDQSIYGWRGADIRNILRFEEDFTNTKVIALEQNYRSTTQILDAASKLIAANKQRKVKGLWTENEDGPAVRVMQAEHADEEAAWIVEDIRRLTDTGVPANEIAVFYRINALSRRVEEALLRAGITYQVARGVEFYNRKEIKDVLAYLRVIMNPRDEVSLLRIINTPARGVGQTTVKRLTAHRDATGRPVIDLIRDPDVLADIGRSAKKLREFAELLDTLSQFADSEPHEALQKAFSESGLRAALTQESEVNADPLQNVEELANVAAEFHQKFPDLTLRDWLEHISLLSDVDAVDDGAGAVTLMTLHASKGLEFAVVYIIGCEEGLLPFEFRGDEEPNYEEERRLLFVGMTRTKRILALTFSQYRTMRGVQQRVRPSRFLKELPQGKVDWLHAKGGESGASSRTTDFTLPEDIDQWEPGCLIKHPNYGLAKLMWMRRSGRQTRAGLRFTSGEDRVFIVEHSDLKRVEYDEVGDDAEFAEEWIDD
jgi:DNA helicase-2/ATP-dependent DNA helicase PcrA